MLEDQIPDQRAVQREQSRAGRIAANGVFLIRPANSKNDRSKKYSESGDDAE